MTDCWNPSQYEKFRSEREQPFFDLLGLVRPRRSMRVVDLGCGTGKQTRALHERLAAAETHGVDRSARMLAAGPSEVRGLSFRQGTIEAFAESGVAGNRPADARAGEADPAHYDLIFSNAALHWVEHHDRLIPALARHLNPGGQLAFQVPAMHGTFTHAAADDLTRVEPFRSAFDGWTRPQPVLAPEDYAALLFESGFAEQRVELVVYPHVLAGAADLVEWMKGTLVTEYQRHLPESLRDAFVDAYRDRVLARAADTRPYFFPFRRILCWGVRPV